MKPKPLLRICLIGIPATCFICSILSKAGDQESQGTTNVVTSASTGINQTETTARNHQPECPTRQVLMQKGFVEKDQGVYQKEHITLDEAKTLLHFDTTDMTPTASGPPTYKSYWVALQGGVCIITIPSKQKDTNDSVVVDLIINTNAIPIGRKLTPRPTPGKINNTPVNLEEK